MTDGPRLRVTWQSRWGLPIGYAIHSEEMALGRFSRAAWTSRSGRRRGRGASHIADPVLEAIAERPPYEDAPQVSYEQADLFLHGPPRHRVGFTMLEVDGIPRAWADACNRDGRDLDALALGRRALRRVRRHEADPRGAARLRRRSASGRSPGPAGRARGSRSSRSSNGASERRRRSCCARTRRRSRAGEDDVLLVVRANNHDGHVDVPRQIEELGLPNGTARRSRSSTTPHPREPARHALPQRGRVRPAVARRRLGNADPRGDGLRPAR